MERVVLLTAPCGAYANIEMVGPFGHDPRPGSSMERHRPLLARLLLGPINVPFGQAYHRAREGIGNVLFRQEVGYCWARELSSMRVLGLESGIFGPFIGPRRYVSERFGVSGERGLGGVGSAAEPDGIGDRWGIGPVGIDRGPSAFQAALYLA